MAPRIPEAVVPIDEQLRAVEAACILAGAIHATKPTAGSGREMVALSSAFQTLQWVKAVGLALSPERNT